MRPAPLPPRLLGRLNIAAFAMDAATFLLLAAIPYKILALGGTPLELGLIPAFNSVTYILVTRLAGAWSDRRGRERPAVWGGLALLAFVPLAAGARNLLALGATMPLLGLSGALFWPPTQATVGDLAGATGRLARDIGRFNVAWCLGKACGYFWGGWLLASWNLNAAFAAGGALGAAALVALPRGRVAAAARTGTPPADTSPPGAPPEAAPRADADRDRFRRLAWLANFAAYGAAGVLNHQLPKWFAVHGWSEKRFGLFVGATFLSQAASFGLLSGRVRFAYSVRRLLLSQAGAAAIMALLPLVPSFPWLLGLAPVLGTAFGVTYAASIYTSLDAAAGKGRNAGIHESLVGAGTFLLPLLGGAAARYGGWLAAPYWLSSLVILAAMAVEGSWWRQRARSA